MVSVAVSFTKYLFPTTICLPSHQKLNEQKHFILHVVGKNKLLPLVVALKKKKSILYVDLSVVGTYYRRMITNPLKRSLRRTSKI